MQTSLQAALQHVRQFEGGYADDPRDRGGCTNHGITLATLRRYLNQRGTCADVRALTWEQAAEIYHRGYWATVRADELPAGLDLCVFDHAVNAGPGSAIRLLQRVLRVTEDGVFGEVTLTAVRAVEPQRVLIARYTTARANYYRSLRQFATYGKGWLRRAEAAEDAALTLMPAQKKSQGAA